VSEPPGPARSLADHMRQHAGDSQHLYGHLMRAMADDLEHGGPVQDICAGLEEAPAGWVVQLRLLAGLFRIVLTGRAPELEPYYPCLGGTADPGSAWPSVRKVLGVHIEELHDALDIAPQTNEVGRANALVLGIFAAVHRTGRSRVRLLEPGASAGLNLLVDQFRFINESWAFGPPESLVRLVGGVHGDVHPVSFDIIERRGCDLSPVDISTEEGRLRLRSFVWPFHVERHQRLAGALKLAQQVAPKVDRGSAGGWLERHLGDVPPDDVVTVVWQSVTRQYWPPEEVVRVNGLAQKAAEHSALAHVSMEYPNDGSATAVLTIACSGADGRFEYQRVGTVGDHGFPVDLDGS
jgi:hypothetical protein